MKQSGSMENLKEENFYSAMRLEKYGPPGLKLKISGFVSFLAWTGMMAGVLGILFSAELFIHPTDTSSPYYPDRLSPFDYDWMVMSYVVGVVGILSSAVWLALHLALRKRNLNKDFQGIKKILKIKCYITGAVEIIANIMGIIAVILMAILTDDEIQTEYSYSYRSINILLVGSYFLYLVFACFKIHGVRKDNNRFINSYIVFKLILFVVFFAVGIFLLAFSSGSGCLLFIFCMILLSFVYIYYLGALVVLYNFNHHCNSKTNYKNLAFTNQTFLDGNTKCQA